MSLVGATQAQIVWPRLCVMIVAVWCSLRLCLNRLMERAPDNPWPQWPRVYQLDYGQKEAKAKFGADPRSYSIMTKQFVGDDEGRLTAVHTIDIRWESNGDGLPHLTEIPGTEREWPAQLVLLAMGFLGPEGGLLEQLGVERDGRSNAKAAYGQYTTNARRHLCRR